MSQLIKYLVFLFIASLPLEKIISLPFLGSLTSLIGILIFFLYIIDSLKIKRKTNYPVFFKIYLPILQRKPLSQGLAIEMTEPFFKTLNISSINFSKLGICSSV